MNGLAIRDEEIRERVLTVHERFLGLLSALIEQGIQEGQFREIDPLAGAMLLKATMDGLVGQAAIGVPPDTDRLLTDGIRVVLAGLVRPEGAKT